MEVAAFGFAVVFLVLFWIVAAAVTLIPIWLLYILLKMLIVRWKPNEGR